MTRKMLPVMIGAILTGGMLTAHADVTLFGHIDTSVDATDVDGGSDDTDHGKAERQGRPGAGGSVQATAPRLLRAIPTPVPLPSASNALLLPPDTVSGSAAGK